MAIQVVSGASNTILTVDPVSDAARVSLYDPSGNSMADITLLNQVLNALNAASTIILAGQETVSFSVEGTTGTLTLSFEYTTDNINWYALTSTPVSGGATVTSTSANGHWIASIAGFLGVRARISVFTSGSMTVSITAAPGTSKFIAQAVAVSGTIPISGTVTSNQGTPAVIGNSWPVEVTDGTNILGTPTHPVRTDPTGTTPQPASQSGTWNINNISGTVSLPTGASTAANQTTLGSQTTKINDGTNTAAVTGANALKVDGSAVTQPVSGTVTANIGTSGALALDATLTKLTIAQSTALGSNTQALMGGSVTTSAPTYTTGNINPLSLTTAGALRTDSSAVTQPISGTVTANQGGAPWSQNLTQVGGSSIVLGQTTASASLPVVIASDQSAITVVQSTAANLNATVVQSTAANLNATVTQQTITKGTQGSTGVTTQDLKDAGRVIKQFTASFTAATTEAMVTLTPVTDGTTGGTGTSFTVTSGKRLRLQSVMLTCFNVTAAIHACQINVRMSSSGAVTTATPILATVATTTAAATINLANSQAESFPDGVELSGTMQVGISQIGIALAGQTVVLVGYEY